MNSTMIRKFCTLKEAAERLNVTEDQIESLLRKGLLREFRDGSHRLLRTSDIGAIVMAQNRRRERQGQPLTKPERSSVPGQTGGRRPPRPASISSQGMNRQAPRLGATGRDRPGREMTPSIRANRPAARHSHESSSLSDGDGASRGRTKPQPQPLRQSLSLREWFWMGLIQDRPVAIALLSGLILLALSAAVAGVYKLAHAF